MSPAAVQYIARSAAYETARTVACGMMTPDEQERWRVELDDLYNRVPEAERKNVMLVGSPPSRAAAMNEFFAERRIHYRDVGRSG